MGDGTVAIAGKLWQKKMLDISKGEEYNLIRTNLARRNLIFAQRKFLVDIGRFVCYHKKKAQINHQNGGKENEYKHFKICTSTKIGNRI